MQSFFIKYYVHKIMCLQLYFFAYLVLEENQHVHKVFMMLVVSEKINTGIKSTVFTWHLLYKLRGNWCVAVAWLVGILQEEDNRREMIRLRYVRVQRRTCKKTQKRGHHADRRPTFKQNKLIDKLQHKYAEYHNKMVTTQQYSILR